MTLVGLVSSAEPRASSAPVRDPLEAVVTRFRARATRRLAWLKHGRDGLNGSHGLLGDLGAEVALQERDDPEAERQFYRITPELERYNRDIERAEETLASDTSSPLSWICQSLGVSEGELDLLASCLAVALEPALSVLCAQLHGHRALGYVSEALVAKLCGRRLPLLGASGPLRQWRLVESSESGPGEPTPLRLDPFVFGFASGSLAWDAELVGRVSQPRPHKPLPDWPVAEVAQRVQAAWRRDTPVMIAVTGPRSSGRRSFAACVGQELGLPVVAIDSNGVPDERWPALQLFAQRQALLLGHALLWTGARAFEAVAPAPAVAALQFAQGDPESPALPSSRCAVEYARLPAPTVAQRRDLWWQELPECRAWPQGELDQLAERYAVQIGDIVSIARRGVATADAAREHCREVTRGRLGELGTLLGCPFSWDDLLLPDPLRRSLQELLYEARERVRFWEGAEAQRLFPRGRGLVSLFVGAPGTGKTMAAQVVARELGLDLFRIDLASSISKYIGETAKNLRKIFTRAAEMNAVLLFDEADALFSKRTEVNDAHDRYANTDTNYLLQMLEDFQGIALLASNKKHNMDSAFVRRIRYVLDFPTPGPRERYLIWRGLVVELLGESHAVRLDPELSAVAQVLELSGAQIKLALLAAMFSARRDGAELGLGHLYRGLDRELSKEGRAVGPKERERIQRAASASLPAGERPQSRPSVKS